MKSPVLFIIFKREDTTRKVFERIREARPPKLYVAADGPRSSRTGESYQCEMTRMIIDNVDWPCEVHKLFRVENLGCGHGVSSAITWFFENEPEGIILEDDILPHLDFFKYCDEMLERYRYDNRIQMICGHSCFFGGIDHYYSYYMSSYMQIWGWASWRRVWKTYQLDASKLDKRDFVTKLNKRIDKKGVKHFIMAFDMMASHNDDTWDYQMFFNQILFERYSIIPYLNLTENIGFGNDSTHTDGESIEEANNKATSPYPIVHHQKFSTDYDSDLINMYNTDQCIRNYRHWLFRKLKEIETNIEKNWNI